MKHRRLTLINLLLAILTWEWLRTKLALIKATRRRGLPRAIGKHLHEKWWGGGQLLSHRLGSQQECQHHNYSTPKVASEAMACCQNMWVSNHAGAWNDLLEATYCTSCLIICKRSQWMSTRLSLWISLWHHSRIRQFHTDEAFDTSQQTD